MDAHRVLNYWNNTDYMKFLKYHVLDIAADKS